MTRTIDVVVVSYNSSRELRRCVEPLSRREGVRVFVVDNASSDGSLDTVADLDATLIRSNVNRGFAAGCNLGWRAGSGELVLFLNPDAQIGRLALAALVAALDDDSGAAIVAPRIVDEDGRLQLSLRRFPRLRSTYAQALFLYRLAPKARWSDEIIRDRRHYERRGAQEWVSGACMLVRRRVLEELEGWDEGYFLYCEDIDLCRRAHALGHTVLFEPRATVVHVGGASSPRATTLPLLAASRMRYARLHRSRTAAALERGGIALEALMRLLTRREGSDGLRGHLRSLRILVGAPS